MAHDSENRRTRAENAVSDSLIRIELITHFHRNPGLEGTSLDLANMIGRDKSRVENQMKKLVQLHILHERFSEGELHYRYMPPQYMSISSEKGAKRRPDRFDPAEDGRESSADSA